MSIVTGQSTNTGASGGITVSTGSAVTGNSGSLSVVVGRVTTSGTTGSVSLSTGASVVGQAGSIVLSSGERGLSFGHEMPSS